MHGKYFMNKTENKQLDLCLTNCRLSTTPAAYAACRCTTCPNSLKIVLPHKFAGFLKHIFKKTAILIFSIQSQYSLQKPGPLSMRGMTTSSTSIHKYHHHSVACCISATRTVFFSPSSRHFLLCIKNKNKH